MQHQRTSADERDGGAPCRRGNKCRHRRNRQPRRRDRGLLTGFTRTRIRWCYLAAALQPTRMRGCCASPIGLGRAHARRRSTARAPRRRASRAAGRQQQSTASCEEGNTAVRIRHQAQRTLCGVRRTKWVRHSRRRHGQRGTPPRRCRRCRPALALSLSCCLLSVLVPCVTDRQ